MRARLADIVWVLVSPTRRYIDWWKNDECAKERGDRLRSWSFWLFALELLALIGLACFLPAQVESFNAWIRLLILFLAWSRVNEICYAFYCDALSREKKSNLERWERIRMAMRSYFGLCFNFSLFYYFLPVSGLFNRVLNGFWEAFYFSGVTIATLGYGDIFPSHPISQALAVWEVLAGILIIAVAIARYAGGEDAPNPKQSDSAKQDDVGTYEIGKKSVKVEVMLPNNSFDVDTHGQGAALRAREYPSCAALPMRSSQL